MPQTPIYGPWKEVLALRKAGYTGRGIAVGHLDSGVEAEHPALRKRIAAYQLFDLDGTPASDRSPFDDSGHGTHTAGIICGKERGFGHGVAPKCRLHVAGVLERGRVLARVLAGLDWLYRQPVRIVAMPLGVDGHTPVFSTMLTSMARRQILVVAPIGNKGAGRHHTPGASADVLSVGAVDSTGRVPSFSGSCNLPDTSCIKPDILAPGVDIVSAAPGGKRVTDSGTSMAAAFVAGVAALLLEACPQATPNEICRALTETAYPLGEPQRHRCRTGIIAPQAALAHLHRKNRASSDGPPSNGGVPSPRIDPRLVRLMDWAAPKERLPAILLLNDAHARPSAPRIKALLDALGKKTSRPRRVRVIEAGGLALFEGRTDLLSLLADHPEVRYLSAQDVDLIEP